MRRTVARGWLRWFRRPIVAVVGAAVVLATIAVTYAVHAARTAPNRPVTPEMGTAPSKIFGSGPTLLFRSTALGPGYGYVASLPLIDGTPKPGAKRSFTPLVCDRVYAARDTILCLTADRGVVTTYRAVVYDAKLRPRHTVTVPGLPSRARLSADGRMASWTVFVYGDSYISQGFSTRTSILDTQTGTLVANLESFSITLNGKPYSSVDVNFWGVTFAADDNTFYATLATKGQTYLVRGDLAKRSVVTLRTNVECPSLSPDGTRLVFKKRVSKDLRAPWRLAVLDLTTMKETLLAETRSVDDQAAWLDDHTVIYALPEGETSAVNDVWAVPADGTGTPRKVVDGAFSPAVIG